MDPDSTPVSTGTQGSSATQQASQHVRAHRQEGNRCCLKSMKSYSPLAHPGSNWVTGVKSVAACEGAETRDNLVSYTDAQGSDAGWFTADYASGGVGSGGGDRLFNIGWATKMNYPVVDGPAGGAGKYSGLTLPREIHYDPRIQAHKKNDGTLCTAAAAAEHSFASNPARAVDPEAIFCAAGACCESAEGACQFAERQVYIYRDPCCSVLK